jgi:hypothetical protein
MVEFNQAVATLVVIGSLITIVWLHYKALRLGYVSETLIEYEILALLFVVISSLIVDFVVFDGVVLLDPLIGPGLVDSIHNYIVSMSVQLRSFIWFMVMYLIASVMFAIYYVYLNHNVRSY